MQVGDLVRRVKILILQIDIIVNNILFILFENMNKNRVKM